MKVTISCKIALLVLLAVLGTAAIADAKADGNILVVFSNTHIVSMGLYWIDPSTDHEKFLEVLPAGTSVTQLGKLGDTFVVRSADFQFRQRAAVIANDDPQLKSFPYKITFTNIGDKSVELKHGEAGYLWIEPTREVSQVTHTGHTFALMDKSGGESTSILSLRLEEAEQEL